MLLDLIFSGFDPELLIALLMWIPIILLSLSVHESAHAYAAYKLGDPTSRNLGRCTLNPAKHIDPFGFLSMLIIGFGWAKPVQINTRNFEKPRVGFALSSLAGPVSNLLLAIVMAFLFAVTDMIYFLTPLSMNETASIVFHYIEMFFFYGVWLNVSLAIFNFIPVPPLDGSRILGLLLPPKAYFKYLQYERYTGIVFAVIVIVLGNMGISLISWIVQPVTLWIISTVGSPIYSLMELIM